MQHKRTMTAPAGTLRAASRGSRLTLQHEQQQSYVQSPCRSPTGHQVPSISTVLRRQLERTTSALLRVEPDTPLRAERMARWHCELKRRHEKSALMEHAHRNLAEEDLNALGAQLDAVHLLSQPSLFINP